MDRLKELKAGVNINYDDEVSIEMTSKNNTITLFYSDIEIIINNITYISNAIIKISYINEEIIQSSNNNKEQELILKINPFLTNINKKAILIKKMLTNFSSLTGMNKGEERIVKNCVQILTTKFKITMNEFQIMQSNYKIDIQNKAKRQLKIIYPKMTNDNINSIINNKSTEESLKSAILNGSPSSSIHNAYINISDKYQHITELESSIAELYNMFIDFALLTDYQCDLLNSIENQVSEASEYVGNGNDDLNIAINLQIQIRKKQLCCAMSGIFIVGIIIIIIVVSLKLQN